MGLISNVKNSVTKSFNNTMKKVETVATNVKNEVVKTAKEAAKETKVAVKNLVVDPFKKALNDTGATGSIIGAGTSIVDSRINREPSGTSVGNAVKSAVRGAAIEVVVRTGVNMVSSYYSPNGAQRKYINGQQ